MPPRACAPPALLWGGGGLVSNGGQTSQQPTAQHMAAVRGVDGRFYLELLILPRLHAAACQ